jgi:hypothetical protein
MRTVSLCATGYVVRALSLLLLLARLWHKKITSLKSISPL